MNDNVKAALRNIGFIREVARVTEGLCPFCGRLVKDEDFTDDRSRREFGISGICQKCQDRTFKRP